MFLKELECTECGKKFSADRVQTICERCDAPLFARYDLERVRDSLDREELDSRYPSMWRYREFLPVEEDENIVTLGEGFTPIDELDRLNERSGFKRLYLKDEGIQPTGTFKSRGLAMGVSKAKELGVQKIAMPSAGNAAGALSAYGSRAGMDIYVVMPKTAPEACIVESYMLGADVYLVDGLLPDCGEIIDEGKERYGWFSISTTKEPYRVEGKKTMGLELAEQFCWELPDAILYPTGGGTGLIGMWKAFAEMRELGWIDGPLPRMIAVQAEGCAPMVRAFENGDEFAQRWEHASTMAAGIRVPQAVGDFLILRAVRESNGRAIAVSESAIVDSWTRVAREDGLLLCPEGAATHAAWREMVAAGELDAEARVVLFNCATGLKYSLPS